MPRPCKRRRICELPSCRRFVPDGETFKESEAVVMTIDEFETIRLLDHENMTQEECARQMNVARTTVQAIYTSARKKVATSLLEKRALQIAGGDFELCKVRSSCCEGGCCKGRCGTEKCSTEKFCCSEPCLKKENR